MRHITAVSLFLSALLVCSSLAQEGGWLQDYDFNDQRGLPDHGSRGIPENGYGWYHRFGRHNCNGPAVPYTYQAPSYYVKYHDYDYDDLKIMGMDADDYRDMRRRYGYRGEDPVPAVIYAPAPVHAYPAPGVLQRNEPPIVYNNGPVAGYNELPRHVYTRDDYSESGQWHQHTWNP